MDAAYAANGLSSDDYWAKRAKPYRQALHERTDQDPFFCACATAFGRHNDAGCRGRHGPPHTGAGALVARVTAVDPSEAMLGYLREDVASQGLQNVQTVLAEWMDADLYEADVVLCSHVFYPIAEVVPFIRKLYAHAREQVFVYLRVDPLPTDLGLWSEFHGSPLQLQPTALDLLNVLSQIGIAAELDVVQHRFTWTFADLDEAVEHIRNTLCLREDDAGATAKLRRLLEERLVSWPNGRLGPNIASARSGIITWKPHRS